MHSNNYDKVVLVDYEYIAPPGEKPEVLCCVAKDLRSGKQWRLWRDDLIGLAQPPFPIDDKTVVVAFFSSAEWSVHLAQGWPLPSRVIDLYVEYRALTNGGARPHGSGLVGALQHLGLSGIGSVEKSSMRDLILRGGPFSDDEREAILDYCAADVAALELLFKRMEPFLDWGRALLRGRYMCASARMQHAGIPIDVSALERLKLHWKEIQLALIDRIGGKYGVFDGVHFRTDLWERWLGRRGVGWPRLASGRLALDEKTFKRMAALHQEIEPMRQLRSHLANMRLNAITIGGDDRNRVILSPFQAKSGRNQPSNSKYIFGPAKWLRSLIKPTEGFGLAYIDWCQQEIGIAAALSGDPALKAAYESGDPYLAFARQAGAVPEGATKASHPVERELFKACSLAVLYGMSARSLAIQIGRPEAVSRELLASHHKTYPVFWDWSDRVVDHGMLHGKLHTTFGWPVRVGEDPNPRSLRNFPMQANGAEMLRLACCLGTERGVTICAPVHDAVLIEAPLAELDDTVLMMRTFMAEASRIVLAGFELSTDVHEVRYPDRYFDGETARRMWDLVWSVVPESRDKSAAMTVQDCPPGHSSFYSDKE